VPLVVVDTSIALPATLSPGGLARRFWVLLALGALTLEVDQLRLEREALEAEAAAPSVEVHGAGFFAAAIEDAEQRRAALLDALPVGVPDDWTAAGSAPLFDEYERKLREKGRRFDPALGVDDIAQLRRQFETVCVAAAPPFDPIGIPAHTRDPHDDPVVHTALLADADYLLSDDRDIAPDPNEAHVHEYGEHRVTALRFGLFMREYFEPADLDWGAIDGRILSRAFRRRGDP
jgi:predicted nucleic acid-binding protein